MNPRRLHRSDDDRMIAGVAAGVADYFDLDPTIVRIAWLILIPFTSGIALAVYVVMAIILPDESDVMSQPNHWQPRGEPVSGGYPANYSPPPSGSGRPSDQPDASAGVTGNAGSGQDAAAAGGPGYAGPGFAAPGQVPGSTETTQSWTPGDAGAGGAPGWGAPYAAGSPSPAGSPTPGSAGAPYPPSAPYPPASPFPPGSRDDRRWQRRQARWERRQQRWQNRADRWEARREDWERGGRSGSIVWGLLLILVGGVLLLDRVDPQFSVARTWPILLVGFGLILVVLAFVRGLWED